MYRERRPAASVCTARGSSLQRRRGIRRARSALVTRAERRTVHLHAEARLARGGCRTAQHQSL